MYFAKLISLAKNKSLGYATDLRVSPSRKAILQWSQHFLPLLEQECEKRNTKYIFSVLARSQQQAYNAFVRPRSTRRTMARYYLFRRFNIVGLHGKYPFAPKPINTIDIRYAREEDHTKLAQYIIKQKSKQPIYYCEDDQRFFNSIYRWQGLSLDDFLIAL